MYNSCWIGDACLAPFYFDDEESSVNAIFFKRMYVQCSKVLYCCLYNNVKTKIRPASRLVIKPPPCYNTMLAARAQIKRTLTSCHYSHHWPTT